MRVFFLFFLCVLFRDAALAVVGEELGIGLHDPRHHRNERQHWMAQPRVCR